MAEQTIEQTIKQTTKPDQKGINTTTNIAVSSRALFKLDEEHDVFEKHGLKAYLKLQEDREKTPLLPGTAFPLIKALDYVNSKLLEINKDEVDLFSVVMMSRNHAGTGLRFIKSLQEHKLLDVVERMCLTDGKCPVQYIKSYNVKLFLTTEYEDVAQALESGHAAAVVTTQKVNAPVEDELRVAFDLDAVLFDDESEKVFKSDGFDAYRVYEQKLADIPLKKGPLKEFAVALGRMQTKFREAASTKMPIRTYFITARTVTVGERAIHTLKEWNLELNEIHFLSGAPKGHILEVIRPHIFFDDGIHNIESAQEFDVPSAHVSAQAKK